MTQVTIPDTIELAVDRLGGLGRLASATEWERAAVVAAYVEEAEQPGPQSSTKSSRTPGEFAALGIVGLKSKDTVRRYVRMWAATGLPRPTPGEEAALPDISWEETLEQLLRGTLPATRPKLTVVPERSEGDGGQQDAPEPASPPQGKGTIRTTASKLSAKPTARPVAKLTNKPAAKPVPKPQPSSQAQPKPVTRKPNPKLEQLLANLDKYAELYSKYGDNWRVVDYAKQMLIDGREVTRIRSVHKAGPEVQQWVRESKISATLVESVFGAEGMEQDWGIALCRKYAEGVLTDTKSARTVAQFTTGDTTEAFGRGMVPVIRDQFLDPDLKWTVEQAKEAQTDHSARNAKRKAEHTRAWNEKLAQNAWMTYGHNMLDWLSKTNQNLDIAEEDIEKIKVASDYSLIKGMQQELSRLIGRLQKLHDALPKDVNAEEVYSEEMTVEEKISVARVINPEEEIPSQRDVLEGTVVEGTRNEDGTWSFAV